MFFTSSHSSSFTSVESLSTSIERSRSWSRPSEHEISKQSFTAVSVFSMPLSSSLRSSTFAYTSITIGNRILNIGPMYSLPDASKYSVVSSSMSTFSLFMMSIFSTENAFCRFSSFER